MDLHVVSRAPTAEGPGHGALVAMVHGAMDRASSFRRVWRHLPDFAVVAYDRRGYAGSAGIGPSTDFVDQVSDLVWVLSKRPAVVVGHSFGGNVVLATAQSHPELVAAAVIYEAPAPWRPKRPREDGTATEDRAAAGQRATPEDRAEAFMRRMVGDRIWERLPEATRAQRRAEGPALLAELRALRAGRPFDPSQITVPVVVGYGSASGHYVAESASQLASSLPRGELVAVPDAGHGIHLAHPGALATMIRSAAGAVG